MPAHSETAGSIILAEAYALGKMVDSSGWNGLLERKITPSDIDLPEIPLCFDNNGAIIFVDLSNCYDRWDSHRTLRGQRWLYESLIKHGPHCAVLCKHGVVPEMDRKIDSLRDVESFHVMLWDHAPVYSQVYNGAYWQSFVTFWVNKPTGPLNIRRYLLGVNAGLVKPTTPPPTEEL